MRYLALLAAFLALPGCSANADDKPPAEKKLTYAETVAKFELTVAGLAADLGNNTGELNAVKEELKAVKQQSATIEKYVRSMNGDIVQIVDGQKKLLDLLSLSTEISLEVPKAAGVCIPAAPPVKADAVPIENADRRTVTLHGKPLDVAAVIKANYRVRWSHPGTIDGHLKEHGVAGFEGLDGETKEKLHSALHEMGQAPAKAVAKSKAVVKAPIALPQAANCPSGNCPNVQSYGYSKSRSRLFGWRR